MSRQARQARLGTKGSVSEDLLKARSIGGLRAARARPRRKGGIADLAGTVAAVREHRPEETANEVFAAAQGLLLEQTSHVLDRYREPTDPGDVSSLGNREIGAHSLRKLLLSENPTYGDVAFIRGELSHDSGHPVEAIQEAEAILIDEIAQLAHAAATAFGTETPPVDDALSRVRGSLDGVWFSRYYYTSSESPTELHAEHYVVITTKDGWLHGRSRPHTIGSVLRLDLRIDSDSILTGFWTERTSKGPTYSGAIQLLVDAIGHNMRGKWLGYSRRYEINVGIWDLRLVEEAIDDATVERFDFRL